MNRNVRFDNPKFGIVVEVDAQGRVVRSLQDPQGGTYTGVSEVQEDGQGLYFASPGKTFIGYIRLDALVTPSPTAPPPKDQNGE